MSPIPDAILPPLSTLLRNNSSTSSGSSSPPASPLTPRDAPISYFDMNSKRRAAAPAPLTTLPPLTSSIPLTRKPSDERRNISALLNEREPTRQHESSNPPPHAHGPSQPGFHQLPPPNLHGPPSSSLQQQVPHPPHHQQPQHPQHPQPPHHPVHRPSHGPQPPHDHHASHEPHHIYPQHPHHHHHHPGSVPPGPPIPPPHMSAPLMSAPGGPPMGPSRGYFSPPPSRQSYDHRPPTAPHPDLYGRPDMGRRHTYHPAVYEYPVYEMGVPVGYHPAFIGVPFDGGMGTRAPISRTTKACDACRSRKVRCDAGGMPGSTGTCSRCRESGRLCVYTATQKKRGPTPGRPARSQSSSNVVVDRRTSMDAGSATSDRRQTWSSSGHPPSSAGDPSRSSAIYAPHSAGPAPSVPWPYQYGYDERDVRHHPYRPPSGPRTAPLVERHRPSVSGWELQQGQPLPPPPPPPHPVGQAPPPPGPSHHPHEPRQPPIFDANYSLHPHPSSAWPQGPRRDYGYPPEYSRRSGSPPAAVRLAPLRRD